MSKFSKVTFKLIDLIVMFVMIFSSPMSVFAQEDIGPKLATDKTDYAPGEIAQITGARFTPGDYVLAAMGPDAAIANWASVTADENGNFASGSPALDATGSYEVRAYAASWAGDWSEASVASISLTVTAPPPPPTATEPPTADPTPAPVLTPFIQSDKADYAPGELVTLTGGNWQGDTQVRIFVNDDVGQTWSRDVIVNVATDNTIVDSFNLPNWFVASYVVSASGQQTGRVVTMTFTDSQEDYKHYGDKAPAGWQNGALQNTNSQYFEGEVVPHYWKTEGLIPGQYYGFNVYYDYYDTSSGGYCGFDFMAQYNISRNPPPVGSSPYPIASIPAGSGALYTVGAGDVYTSGPYNAGIQRFIQVRFLATTPKVEFYWGLHLAQPGANSGCQGAKAWPGASLQSDVRNTPQFTQYMLGGGGSMQINPGAVIRGTISGFKWNDLDGDGVVDGNEPKLSAWPIRLCYDSGCNGIIQTTTTDASGNYSFNVAPGTYFVREIQQSGWSQTWPPSGYYGPLTINASTPTYANINFGNRQGSSITIVKDAVPNDPQDFPFYGTFSSFPLDDDSDPSLSNSRTYSNLPPGGYTVGENPISYWDFSGIKCTGDNGNTVINPGSPQVQINLDPGENIVCTFTNTKRGTIIINKTTNGGDATFAYITTGGDGFPANFSITTSGGSGSQTFSNIVPGTYSVSEAALLGWDLTKSSCSTGTPGSFTVEPGGTVSCTFTNTMQNPVLTLVKTVTPITYDSVGDVINYSYLVTNDGNIKLVGPVSISDDKATVTCPDVNTVGNLDSYLDPNETITCTASYTITQTDLDNGSVKNIAQAHANGTDSNFDDETVTAAQTRTLSLVKSAEPTTYSAVGDIITYNYLVTNTGNVNFVGPVTVTDDKATVICPAGGLAPLASMICTASYTITQADLDDGSVKNTAQAHANDIDSNTDDETVSAAQNPALTIVKTATPATYSAVGAVINYSYLVINSGNVTLSGPFTVSDDKAADESCPVTASLVPGALITCTASYTITQADLDAGSVTNVAYATNGTVTSPTDTETVDAAQSPALTIVKTATPTTYSTVGTIISYSYLVTNSGNITLSGPFTVIDDKAADEGCPTTASLAPGASITCIASYIITQVDLDAGSVTNIASATNGAVTSDEATATVTAIQSKSLSLTKAADPTTYNSVGQLITYSYVIKNTGNVTLAGPFSIADDKATVTCTQPADGQLSPNETMSCTATYTITQADLDAGKVTNLATASGGGATSNQATATIDAVQAKALALTKTADPIVYDHIGQTITYSYVIKNTGNVTLTGPFSVVDDKATVTCTQPADGKLSPDETMNCSATYSITQTDLNAGSVTNKATASGGGVTSNEATATVTADQNPSLTLDKTATPSTYDDVGDVINYSYLLTNSGNVTLSGPFTVTDDKATVACTINQSPINPADVVLFDHFQNSTLASYTNGTLTYVEGPTGFGQAANFSPDGLWSRYQMPYWNAQANGGSVDLWVYLTEYKTSIGLVNFNWNNTNTPPPAGHVLHLTINNGKLTEGGWNGVPTIPMPQGQTTIPLNQWTHVAFTWGPSGSRLFVNGVEDAYSPGNVFPALSSPTYVYVPYWGQTNPAYIDELRITNHTQNNFGIGTLAPEASTTCTASYTITQADLDAGSVTNTATGHAFFGTTPVNSNIDTATVTADQNPALTILKTATPDIYHKVDDVIVYSYKVTNSGNVTLYDAITVTDDKATATCPALPAGGLAPGAFITCTASYTIIATDITAGTVTNSAYAESGTTQSNTDTETVTFVNIPPDISVTKTADPTSVPETGGNVTFTFVVTNNATEAATITSLSDSAFGTLVGDANCKVDTIIPAGESCSFTTIFAIPASDFPDSHTNTFTAIAVDPEGFPDTATDNETVTYIDVKPDISVLKTANPTSVPETGADVTFTFKVTNNGSETATISSLSDSVYGILTGDVDCQAGTELTSGASCEFSITEFVSGDFSGEPHHNVFTGKATDNDGNEDTATDDETVTYTDVKPVVTLEKNVDIASLPEPGGNFTFKLTITNDSTEVVTITALTDDNTLSAECTVLIGTTLAASASLSCTYTVNHTEADSYENTASVTVKDNDGNSASDDDKETVTVTDVLPTVTLDKSVTPSTLPEPGGIFTFTLTITNTSVENVEITGLGDSNVLSPENSPECLALVHTTLIPEQSVSCEYVVTHTDAETYENTASVTVTDNEGNSAGDSDSEAVTVTDVPPTIELTKSVDSNGTFNVGDEATFTLTIKNTSPEAVTITALTDDNTLFVECFALIGTSIPAGETISCTYKIVHNIAGIYPNVASVTVEDNESNSVIDTDDESITVYAPTVSKTANGVYNEVHDWLIYKSVNPTSQDKFAGQTANFTWTIRVDETTHGEDYLVTGVITVVNPNPDDSMLMELTDQLNDGSVATITGCIGGTWSAPNLTVPPATTATCNYTVTPLGNMNAFNAALPDQVTINSHNPGPESYWLTTVSGDGSLNGTYEAWCADIDHTMYPDTDYTAKVYSSYETIPAGLIEYTQNLDLVNWVINQDFVGKSSAYGNYTYGDVQRTIWMLIEDNPFALENGLGSFDQRRVDLLQEAARASGENFKPTCGDFVAVILQPVDGSQLITIAQVTFASLGINCAESNAVTAVLNGNQFPASANIIWTGTPVNPSVTLDDDQNHLFPNLVSDDAVITYNDSLSCPADPAAYDSNGKLVIPDSNIAKLLSGTTVLAQANASTVVNCYLPKIDITKTTNGADGSTFLIGTPLTWQYVVKNIGSIQLTGVTVTDDKLGTITCPKNTLVPNESMTCTATGTAVAGSYANIGSVTGTATIGSTTQNATDTDPSSYFGADPKISLIKSLTEAKYDAAGDTLHYTLVATNDGNVPLSNVSISDPKLGALTCTPAQPTTLAPATTLSCTGAYTTQQSDVDAGKFDNTASTSGQYGGNTYTATASTSVPAIQTPAIDIQKYSSLKLDVVAPNDRADMGDKVLYTFTVTNTGNVTLSGVTVTDAKAGVNCPIGTLAPAAVDTTACTGFYILTQTDIDAGNVYNQAFVTGQDTNDKPVNDDDDNNQPIPQVPSIDIQKYSTLDMTVVAPTTRADVGDIINYTFTITNTGNVTLSGVTVTDAKAGVNCTIGTMAPAAIDTTTCTGSFTLTQTDIDAGNVYNQAFVTGQDTNDKSVNDDDDNNQPIPQVPSIDLVKTASAINMAVVDPSTRADAGDQITFSFSITNTGNVTLTGVDLTDALVAFSGATCGVTTLLPGGNTTCTATYTLTQANINNGSVSNSATTTGTPPAGNDVSDTDGTTTTITRLPSIDLIKTVTSSGPYDSVGDVIIYQMVATNTGNVTLSDVSISDPLLGTLTCTQPVSLAPNASLTCTSSYTVTQSNLDAGKVDNTATVTGKFGTTTLTDTDSRSVSMTQTPVISLNKVTIDGTVADDGLNILIGEAVTWKYTVTNAGNVTLTNVTVSDNKNVNIDCDGGTNTAIDHIIASLAPNALVICTASGTAIANQYNNTGSVTALPPTNMPQTPVTASDTSSYFGADPQIAIAKVTVDGTTSGDGLNILISETIKWRYTVTNVGNVPLSNVTVTDSKVGVTPAYVSGDANSNSKLDLTETWIYEASGSAVTGNYSNTGTASGSYTDSAGHSRTDTATDASSYFGAKPGYTLEKQVSGDGGATWVDADTPIGPYLQSGSTPKFRVLATNTGNVALALSVSDVKLPALNVTNVNLPVGTTNVVVSGPVDGTWIAGQWTNTAVVNAGYTDSAGHTYSASKSDDANYYGADPKLTITKSASPTIYTYAGQVIVYTYVIQNTGNVPLTGPFNITDDKLGTFQCGTATSLAPGASITCTRNYTIKTADVVTNGKIVKSLPTALPVKTTYGQWMQGYKSIMDITLGDTDPALGIPNGLYAGWCIQDHIAGQLKNQNALLYSSIGPNLPADAANLPWNKINYVLNHKIRGVGKTDLQFNEDVQTAIWLLLGEPNPDWGITAEAQQMVNAANANSNYVPGNGDVVAVLVYSDGMGTANPSISKQEAIVEMTMKSITNKAFATGMFMTTKVTSNQAQVTINQVASTGKITPTNTTCQQFRDGTNGDLLDELYSVKDNKINSIAPGVFFYYSKIAAPASSFQIQVTQSNTSTINWGPIKIQDLGQVIVWTANCTKQTATVTYNATTGLVTINVTGATTGAVYYVSVKYNPGSLIGKMATGKPTVQYTFISYLNGIQIVPSWDSVRIKPK